MRPSRRSSRSALPAALAALVLGLLAGCLFIDNPNQLAPGGAGGAGGEGGSDDDGEYADAAPDDGPSLCTKYGGYTGVEAIVAHVETSVAADCRIGRFFTTLDPTQTAHLGDCVVKQFAVLMHCPGIRYDVDNDGVACRDMMTAHAGLGIRAEDFNAFMDDLMTSLHASGISPADVDAMIAPLGYLRGDIVDNSAPGLARSACADGGGG